MTFRDQTALHFTESPDAVQRIVVFRALQLGDMLCAVPALRALRAGYPTASISLIGLPWARAFAARFRRYIDEFIPFPGHPQLPEQERAGDCVRFARDMCDRQFDLAIQLHGDGAVTNGIVCGFGAALTVGYQRASTSVDPCFGRFVPYPDRGSETSRLLRLAVVAGGSSAGDALEFALSEDDRDAARRSRQLHGLVRKPYVCLHVGARDPARVWRRENFARVAEYLHAQGLSVVLTGVDCERAQVDALRNLTRVPCVDLVGKTDIGALAALLADARLLVCNDTGVSHLAAALGVPSIVIFTHSDPERWAPADRSRHKVFLTPSAPRVMAGIRALLRDEQRNVA